jgi:DNA-binding response OmpR family regulator
MTILIIEDDTFFREFYANKLTESGFKVEQAEDGEVGMTKLQTVRPDLILLDLVMPKKDGFAVLTELQAQKSTVPILVFSTLGQEEDVKRAMSLGAKDYVNKTFFDFDKLLAKIKGMIESAGTQPPPGAASPQAQ